MSIDRDAVLGSIQHGDYHAFDDVKAHSEAMGNQVSNAVNVYATEGAGATLDQYEDFAGFDEANRGNFNTAVDQYINEANDILDGFNQKEEATLQAFKGNVTSSLANFFASIKGACQSYVKAINEEKNKVNEAEDNWLAVSGTISQSIDTDASEINPVNDVVINN